MRPGNFAFQMHYRETATWRIGRFDFQIRRADAAVPEIYRRGAELAAFCPDGARLDHAGDLAAAGPAARTARFTATDSAVTGVAVDLRTGLALPGERTIRPDDGWERWAGPGAWTLYFHIPGGGGMTPEKCRESFAEAREFFAGYAPDKKFRLIWSSSWIFNPLWRELLPNSNMAALIDRGRLFPAVPHTPNPGMYFVFGRHDGKPEEFSARNSLEKAVLRGWRERRLRACGFFLPPDAVPPGLPGRFDVSSPSPKK